MKSNKGFSVVILLLCIVTIAAVCGIGYYVFKIQKDDSTSTPKVVTNVSDSTDTNKVDPSISAETKEDESIMINELGIKIPYTEAKNITYTYDNQARDSIVGNTISSVSFYVKDDVLTDQSCNGLGLSLYVLNSVPDGWKYSKVGEKYYVVTGSPSSCGGSTDEDIRSSAIGAINVSNIYAQ